MKVLGASILTSIAASIVTLTTVSMQPVAQAEELLFADRGAFDSSGEQNDWGTRASAASLGQSFARAALNGQIGYSSGRCYQYVWEALRSVLGWQIENLPVPAASAYQFGDWVDANPRTAQSGLALARWRGSARSAPVGSVLVWNPGQCGYNYVHGHIEIKVSDSRACSDFCQNYFKCSEPRVYAPTR